MVQPVETGENNRTKILAELTGIDINKLNSYDNAKANLDAAQGKS